MTMREAITAALFDEMRRDERVMMLGQDIGLNGGVFRVTDGLLAEFGADRVFDAPISEAAIIGSAVGLAIAGMVPVPEIQFMGFSLQAFHQIAGPLARMRYRSRGRFNCQVTVRMPFGGNVNSPELHSDSFDALYAHIPGLKVVVPATAADAKGLLTASIRDPDPVLFLEPLRGYRGIRDDVPEGDHVTPIGKARVARPGSDATIITWGYMVRTAQRAAEQLEKEDNLSVGVLDLRTLAPLDEETIAAAVAETGRVVVVEEANFTAGLAAEVVSTIQERCFYDLEAPVARVTGFDVPMPNAYQEFFVPDEKRIIKAIRETLGA